MRRSVNSGNAKFIRLSAPRDDSACIGGAVLLASDYALIAVADALTGSLRVTDRVARLGGDEFAVILPEATFAAATDTGSKLANEIRRALQNYPPVSVSVGIAWFERAGADFDEMLNAADALMYEIKVTGKHGVQCKHFSANEQAPHEFEAR